MTQWRVTFPDPGSKGILPPKLISGRFPRAGAGAGTGVLDGPQASGRCIPLLSLGNKLSLGSLSLPVPEDCSQEEFRSKDVAPLGLAGAMHASR